MPADEVRAVDLDEKTGLLTEHWSPRVVAQVDDMHVKVVKLKGEFVWHTHDDNDELFLVRRGELTIELRDRAIRLGPGELAVVPRGVEHRPVATAECEVVLLERAGTVNTGDRGGERTAPRDHWI